MANLVIDTTTKPGYFTVDLGAFAVPAGAKVAHEPFYDIQDIYLLPALDGVGITFNSAKDDFFVTMSGGGPYAVVDSLNGSVPADNTALQIALAVFLGDALQIRVFAQITTSATTANQSIISYTVPTGRTAYILGYTIESISNNGLFAGASGPINLGINPSGGTLGGIPGAGGTSGSKYFRQHRLGGASTTDAQVEQQDFGVPRLLAVAGDVIVVLVTPSSAISTTWTVTVELMLR